MQPDADFRLGLFVVRPILGEVESALDGRVRDVGHKPMQLLVFLAQQAGETVTKDAIFAEVWEGAAVGDDVLTVAISTLRRVLGDDARKPRYIMTVPRVGYRMVADVTSLADAADEASTPASRIERAGVPVWAPWILALSLAATMLLLAFGARPQPGAAPPTIESLAVLPLENLTGSASDAHLADGMTAALIARLATDTRWRVTAKRSAAMAAQQAADPTAVARLLDVDAVIEGAVQRFDDALRVTVEVIDPVRQAHLWAGTFDAGMDDALGLQQRVAEAVAARLEGALRRPESDQQAIDAEAFDAYLQGRFLLSRGGMETLRSAIERFDACLARAPGFAPAIVARAEAEIVLAQEGILPATSTFETALNDLDVALSFDPRLARAHGLRGKILFLHRWDFANAERALTRALGLDRSDPLILDAWAQYLATMGRFDEAVAAAERLRAVDPRAYSRPRLAMLLNQARRHGAALAELEAQVEVAPQSSMLHLELALTRLRLGQNESAFDAYREHRRLLGADEVELSRLAAVFDVAGARGIYRDLLATLDSTSESLDALDAKAGGAVEIARLAVGAGEHARALGALARAFDQREPGILRVASDVAFDPLRGQPRFEALIARLGLSHIVS